MSLQDIIVAVAIVNAIVFFIYRFAGLYKKKGACQGCCGCASDKKLTDSTSKCHLGKEKVVSEVVRLGSEVVAAEADGGEHL